MSDYSDGRREYILKSSGVFFNLKNLEEIENASETSLSNFLDNVDCSVLSAGVSDSSKGIRLENKITNREGEVKLIFFKTKRESVTEENIRNIVHVMSIANNTVQSLYHSINQVFVPAFQDAESLEPQLQALVSQLHGGLKSCLYKSENDAVIFTLLDECEYWKKVGSNAKLKSEQDQYQRIYELLEPLEQEMLTLQSCSSLSDLEDVVDMAQSTVDELWHLDRCPYTQPRMEQLMDVIGNDLAKIIQERFMKMNIWEESFKIVDNSLRSAMSGAQKWIDACKKLTTVFWPSFSPHLWKGPPFEPLYLHKLNSRLKDVLRIRSLHNQLSSLLSADENESLNMNKVLNLFSEVNAMSCGFGSDRKWNACVNQFEKTVSPVEERVASRLQKKLEQENAHPLQLLHELSKQKELVGQPNMLRLLAGKRESLLAALQLFLQSCQRELSDRQLQSADMTLDNISWARQLEGKVNVIKIHGKDFLQDLSGYPNLESETHRLLSDVREYYSDIVDGWSREKIAALSNRSLGLRTDAPVVEFEKSRQFMMVNYDPRLVSLVKEARLLAMQGNKIPEPISRAVEQAKQLMKQAKSLEQIANFHNTIGDRMVPSQRPMMLDAALGLSRLVQQESSVTWLDVKAVDAYILQLQTAVEHLAKQNNFLSNQHTQIRAKVMALMGTDLLQSQGQWKDGVREIRDIVNRVEVQKFANMRAWKVHWDRQLYKALEFQYQVGLEALSEHLPEMKIELVFRQQRLQYQPPMEEIRSKYYNQMKRFLSIPNLFRGVGDSKEKSIFVTIIDRNAHRYGPLFTRAEELFGRLDAVKARFGRWVALGTVDLDQLSQQHLRSADDWDRNFRASKAWGQEIARLTCLEEKVECFSISFLPVRAEAEVHNRRYWDILAGSLQASIVSDATKIEKFASDGMEMLRQQPNTAQEIGLVSRQHADLVKSSPEMLALYESAVRKNKTLAAWTKERVDILDKVASIWENLQSVVENHESLLFRQVEAVKSNLAIRCEEINNEAQKFWIRWQQLRPDDTKLRESGFSALQEMLSVLKDRKSEWGNLQETKKKLEEECEHFGLSPPDTLNWGEIEKELASQEAIWTLFNDFQTGINQMCDEEWIVFRSKSYKFEEFLVVWDHKLQEMISKNGVVPLAAHLVKEIEQYQTLSPMLKYVKGDMFSDKHWVEMLDMLGVPNKPVESLLFRDFLNVRESVIAQCDELKDLNARAASEIAIRQALSELDVWEVEAKFSLFEHTDSQGKPVMLVQDFKDLLNKVGDNQCLLQSIRTSPHFDRFADQATIWEKRFATLDECLRCLAQIQRKWLYLEPIFGGGMLTQDQARFHRVDVDFRSIANDIARDRKVLSVCKKGGLAQTLHTLLDQLGRCQKSLNDFLEEKRSVFPRFYFIGDDDLLEILGQSTKEKVVQAHLKKLFAGIHSVSFDDAVRNITAMVSLHGEVVPLVTPVQLSQHVEQWLGQLVVEMKRSLKKLLLQCLDEAKRSKVGPDPLSYPSQVLCLTESIVFTEKCEAAITAGKLQMLLSALRSQLASYTTQDLSADEHTDVLELKLRALVLDTIHHISVVEGLLDIKGLSLDSWAWQRHLRFYLSGDGNVAVKMVDAEFSYTYEYLGNAPKLVHTPLTDKCFLTLTQAMHLGLGGNPLGPAGTGKTESVKALGGLLGRQVLVFNCDEGIDMRSMARIFVGLVKCGAWGCFDEFNRLEEATLSAISMQIQPIQAALKARRQTVVLFEGEVTLDPNSGIFVTMNPAGKGYGGRQKLPDNLKQLFRPVVMSQPDNDLIAEALLHMEGFRSAADIGAKLVEVFTLARQLLSAQQHYDWGLRALKTVLSSCGSALRAARQQSAALAAPAEAEIAVQALRFNTRSKLTAADCGRLDALLNDVFLGVKATDTHNADLVQALKQSFLQLNLEENPVQIRKCVELYEQLQQRMGVVVVGPTGSGKSTLLSLLKHALHSLGWTVKQHTINPKAMPRAQLLGYVDQDTRQWQDGVLTVSAQQVHSETSDVTSWVVCDGDIDPEWVESLNSVLDDNRLMTLPSGWRIQFGPNVNFLFETHDLSQASPATISRMGMILLSTEDLDVKHLVTTWLNKTSSSESLKQLVNDYFYKALEWVSSKGEAAVPCALVGLVRTGLSQLHGVSSRPHFTCALLRGLGSHLTLASRQAFADKVIQWTGEFVPEPSAALHCFYDERRDCLDTYSNDEFENMMGDSGNQLVLTASVKSLLGHLEAWLQDDTRHPFLLIGPQGCGKSSILTYCFAQLRLTDVAEVHCSAQITPQLVVQKLHQVTISISSNSGRVLRPKNAEHLILYFRDLNLAKPDKWGTSMLIEFLQQVLTYKGFYDENLEWVGLEGVQVVGSMSATSGRHALSPRFTSLLAVHSCSYPEPNELKHIYSSLLHHTLSPALPQFAQWQSSGKLSTLVDTLIKIYSEVSSTFTSIQRSHYTFTPHFLTTWCRSLARYSFELGSDPVECVLLVAVHEAHRLFRDMLCTPEDQAKFANILSTTLEDQWNRSLPSLEAKLSDMFYVTLGASLKNNIVFPHGKPLGQLHKHDWTNIVERTIAQHGREQQTLDIVLIPALLKGMASAERVLTTRYGNLLLAGRAGCGRKTAVKLLSTLHAARVLTPNMVSGYSTKNFKKDLKAAMQAAALESDEVYFVVEDHQMVESGFLDMLNSLLASGEVPGLYSTDELEPLVAQLRETAAQEGFVGGPIAYFSECVRRKLHLVLVMDCCDANFIQNCENNPAFYKHCTVQWWDSWDKESMFKIPQVLLQTADDGDESLLDEDSVYDSLLAIHSQAPSSLATPRRYVAFVKLYKQILSTKQRNVKEQQARLKAGVSRLTEARSVVAELRSHAQLQEKQLAEKQEEASKALHLISETMQGANTQKTEMEVLKEQTLKENEQLLRRKKAIDLELAEIEPLIREAQAAVGNIKAEALSEIRSLRAPPDVIRDILEGVLRLMGIHDTSWNSMKTFLAKRGVKEDIRSFNSRNINTESRVAVEKLLQEKRESFEPRNAKRASVAAAPLAAWVIANVKYSVVLEKIRPLEREQNKLHKNLRDAEDNIGKLSSELSTVSERVAELKERLNTYTKEAAEIEISLKKVTDTLSAAENLVGKLNDEYERWKAQLQDLSGSLQELPLQALLSAAFVAYLPGLAEEQRRAQLAEWQAGLGLQGFSLRRFLATEQQLLQWQTEGLSTDQLSFENAIAILQIAKLDPGTGLRPLLMDPASQALEWLKRHFAGRAVEVVAQSSERFSTLLELAVRFGKILIIQEIDAVHPILLPLLRGDLTNQGARCVVSIGDKLVDYHKDFQLFLVSRNAQPDIGPGAAAVTSAINFSTTQAGLSSQLLGCALLHDKPELEARRGQLLADEERLRSRLDQLQENLLVELASAQGDVLQNKELLASLNETKASSAAIASSLAESSRLQESLGAERELYRPLAEFGSLLFFSTQDLARANSCYHFSVSAFVKLFQQALHQTEMDDQAEVRISSVKRRLLRLGFESVGRALFKSDRLMFALHLVRKMFPQMVQDNEWLIFTGQAVVETSSTPVPSWVSQERESAVKMLQCLPAPCLATLQLAEESLWRKFMQSSEAEHDLPEHAASLSAFQRVLVVQALRPDRLHTMLVLFAQKVLGLHDLSPSALNFKKLVNETDSSQPILLLALSGTDPSEELRTLANNAVGAQAFHEVSLGQGQVEVAERLLLECSASGHWLCLKNLHLASKWLPALESLLRSMQPHDSFRLWLTSQPHAGLSPVLLKTCLKVTYEAPQGIKRNLQRTYASWGREMVEASGRQSLPRTQVLFVLAWFHSVVQERCTYVPQGWSQAFEFSDADLRAAVLVLEALLVSGRIKWDYVYGLYESAIYGGRVDNDYDLKVLAIYLKSYFNSNVLSGGNTFGPGIALPSSTKYTDSLNVINQLPDTDKPEYFGLPANIDRSWQRLSSKRVVHQLLILSSLSEASSKADYRKWEGQLAPILNLWKKLNQTGGLVQTKLPPEVAKEDDSPLQQFCALEWRSAVSLIHKVHRSLASLLRVVRGTSLPSPEVADLADSIMKHQTPASWLQLWEGPEEPLQYVRSIVSRASALQSWQQQSSVGDSFNLSELFHPGTFLSALKQQTARLYRLPVSELRLVSSWSSALPTARLPVKVGGLLLEGAAFAAGSLARSELNSPSVTPLPPCSLAWLPKAEASSCQAVVQLPLYQSASRQRLVSSLELPCAGDKDQWLLAGAALFLEL